MKASQARITSFGSYHIYEYKRKQKDDKEVAVKKERVDAEGIEESGWIRLRTNSIGHFLLTIGMWKSAGLVARIYCPWNDRLVVSL